MHDCMTNRGPLEGENSIRINVLFLTEVLLVLVPPDNLDFELR